MLYILLVVSAQYSVMSKMAVGYEPDGSVAPLYDLGWEGPAGQMFSTTSDLNAVSLASLGSIA